MRYRYQHHSWAENETFERLQKAHQAPETKRCKTRLFLDTARKTEVRVSLEIQVVRVNFLSLFVRIDFDGLFIKSEQRLGRFRRIR